jgi:hypothetical protein
MKILVLKLILHKMNKMILFRLDNLLKLALNIKKFYVISENF